MTVIIVLIIAVNLIVFGLLYKKGLAVVGFYMSLAAVIVAVLQQTFKYLF